MVETFLILAISTLGIVLIGYVILTPILRALERPTLLLPWKRHLESCRTADYGRAAASRTVVG
jgi:hypothetical protein